MSFDLKFEAVCDHRVHMETYVLESDRRTVKLLRPVADIGFQVFLNGYEVPSNHERWGWRLVLDPDVLTNDVKMLQFKKLLPSMDNVVQLSFQTSADNCRRCHGLRLYHDISLDNMGRLRAVLNEEKLSQDLEKGVFTERGTNRYASWYGTGIVTLIGTKVVDSGYLRLSIQRDITAFASRMRRMQLKQGEFQTVSLKELLREVLRVDVNATDVSQTSWDVLVEIRNQLGDKIAFVKAMDLYGAPPELKGFGKVSVL
jgi:hypothetical protein